MVDETRKLLEHIYWGLQSVDEKTEPVTTCVRKVRESLMSLIAVMLDDGPREEEAPADAGAPPEPTPGASSSDPLPPPPGWEPGSPGTSPPLPPVQT